MALVVRIGRIGVDKSPYHHQSVHVVIVSVLMKQVIVVRTDLEMSTGKLVAQACHASVAAALCAPVGILGLWNLGGQKKIALRARSLSELVELKQKCEELVLVHALVSDAGRTELAPGTATALAIGPADDKLIDKITGAIPLL